MDLKSQGFNVKAYIHCNPNNPLGDVYNEETNLKLMKICAKHQIHFISDEIYALTIHNSKKKDEFKRLVTLGGMYKNRVKNNRIFFRRIKEREFQKNFCRSLPYLYTTT